MYTIHVDGQLLFSNLVDDEAHVVLSKNLELDANGAGSLSFMLPPSNHLHGNIRKMKSIITVEQDGAEVFRGRAVEIETDIWNQKSVYCEGALSFLLDSVQSPTKFTGRAADLFRGFIAKHNEQVDEEKRFTIGNITAVSESDEMPQESAQDTNIYWNTSELINDNFVNVFGGYLVARHEGGVLYLDWLKELGGNDAEEIRFSVNMLDLKDKTDAGDMFTVLIPLGYSEIGSDGTYEDPVDITSVNGGKNYIQDDEAVALYGKIWRTHTWAATKNPSELLEKARKHLSIGAVLRTLTIKAVDMHFINGSAEMIRIGQNVHIVSEPHGIDIVKACVKMSVDLENPENTSFTFGEKPRTFTESAVRTERQLDGLTGSGRSGGGGRGSVQDEIEEVLRWAYFFKNEHEGQIGMIAGEHDKLENRVTEAEVSIDKGNILLSSVRDIVDEHGNRITEAEASIKVNAEEIELKVSKNGVISAINQTAESIRISASRINLDGYVTASEFSALQAEMGKITSGTVQASLLYTQNLTATGVVRLAGHTCEWLELEAVTGVSLNVAKAQVTINGIIYNFVTGVTISKDTETIDYFGT